VVGIVVVSHSRVLARAAVALAVEMVPGERPPVAVAAGLDDGSFGTDAVAVQGAIEEVDSPDGVVVLCDLGSAVLSAEMALEFLADDVRTRVRISPAPLVEGLVAACTTAAGNGTLADVAAEAANALAGKISHLTGADVDVASTAMAGPEPPAASAVIAITNTHGLHARPAARLVSAVRRFDAQVWLRNGGGPAVPASSLSAVATLGARPGDKLELTAWGPQASAARDAIVALAERGFDDAGLAAPPQDTRAPVGAAPGLAVGPAHQLTGGGPVLPDDEPGPPQVQWANLTAAIARAADEIESSRQRVAGIAGADEAAIFEAHALLLEDPRLIDDVRARIDDGVGAARAWDDAVQRTAQQLADLPDSYQRGRAADVRSVGQQVMRQLVGATGPVHAMGVVVAVDLTPAQAADLDRNTVQAVVLTGGSPTSHAAILARAYGIAMVTGADPSLLNLEDGTLLAVDGDRGEVVVAPSDAVVARFAERTAARAAEQSAAQASSAAPAMTRDGVAIAVLANVGSVDDAHAAAAAHADGAGLVRTEFLFVGKAQAPSRAEQELVYRAIAESFGGSRVVLRTLDVGGDKPLPFLAQLPEANPFLGERGIRLTLRHRELFLDQLVAICAVSRDHPVSVMFPMVSAVAEVVAARELLDAACAEVGGRPDSLRVGIMVEIPSVALKAKAFVPHIDFFSVGTNDLTQYALAVERGNGAVAGLADGLDPGVLRLIAALCDAAGSVPVSVCGELAADPVAVPLLLGLGVRSLSVVPPAVALLKQRVRGVQLGEARRLAHRALAYDSAAEVRAMTQPAGTVRAASDGSPVR
jgi:multiphosphoryl transfer protein